MDNIYLYPKFESKNLQNVDQIIEILIEKFSKKIQNNKKLDKVASYFKIFVRRRILHIVPFENVIVI